MNKAEQIHPSKCIIRQILSILLCLGFLSIPSGIMAASPKEKLKRPKIKSLYGTPFAKRILWLGKKLRKKLPSGWSMEWSLSRLRDIHWMANPHEGYRIRFVHKKKKVLIPIPFPEYKKGKKKLRVVPWRCSLHFYPKKGKYEAHNSLIARLPPAKIFAILRRSIVFQPDRFLAEEYPCPSVMKQFIRLFKISTKGKRWRRPRGIKKALIFPNHLEVWTRWAGKSPWKRWMRLARVRTIVIRQKTPMTTKISIYNK